MQVCIRIIHHLQVAEQVLYLAAVKEALGAHHAVGDVALAHGHFQRAALRIGAEENGKGFPRQVLPGSELLDFVGNEFGFFLAAGHGQQPHRVFAYFVGAQCLFAAACIVADEDIGAVEHLFCATVVFLQFDDGGVGEEAFEVQDVGNLRTAPAVDGLVIIAHHADIVLRADKLAQQAHLQRVGVLELIHCDVGEALVPFLMDGGVTAQQPLGQDEQVIEVHSILRLELAHVGF